MGISVLVMHGEHDQIVPFELTAVKASKLLKNGKLISYPDFPHGMPTTKPSTINADFLDFIQSKSGSTRTSLLKITGEHWSSSP